MSVTLYLLSKGSKRKFSALKYKIKASPLISEGILGIHVRYEIKIIIT